MQQLHFDSFFTSDPSRSDARFICWLCEQGVLLGAGVTDEAALHELFIALADVQVRTRIKDVAGESFLHRLEGYRSFHKG